MDYVMFIVKYDPALVSVGFMAEKLHSLEGVESLKVKDGN